MAILDLSHPILDGQVTYPGLPAPQIGDHLTREASKERYAPGTEFHIGCISMVGNTGTYLDTPFHRFADGWDLAALDLATVAGVPGIVLEGAPEGPTGAAALAGLDISGRAVLVRTGWHRHFGTPEYGDARHPFLSTELAAALVAGGASLVGIDSVNVDGTTTGERPVHTVVLRAGIPIVEHLRGLEALDAAPFRFTAVPAPVRGMGTFPVRAYAVTEQATMPTYINDKLISWATDVDPQTIRQAEKTARLPIVAGHVALMPDAHVGLGATVGSVIPTTGAIIPAAVGVDIGCGMIAAELDLTAGQLPDSLEPLLGRIARTIPAGVGKGNDHVASRAGTWLAANRPATVLSADRAAKAAKQFGTLGSGNHFVEVCLDERDRVWVVLHSGSRGIGNQLAQMHIASARSLATQLELRLEDPDLAYFVEGTADFEAYIADMLWAQEYARGNRELMMDRALREVVAFVGAGRETQRVNCHHNFTQRETHAGNEVWITRKGAIKADVGDLGVIPGSMGTRSYIVAGKGNAASWTSCSHGAGRRHSRTQAKKLFTTDDLATQMAGKVWLADRAGSLVDEIPSAYKDIDQVMADQADLVEVRHTLHQVLNYKGT